MEIEILGFEESHPIFVPGAFFPIVFYLFLPIGDLEGQAIVIKYFFFRLLRSFYNFGRKGSPALIVL
jgi:hypothetical protein